jgi:predicted nuclease of predicted toxin-antitoxin system
LSVSIIADENIDSIIIQGLRYDEYEVLSIKESYRGIKDIDIIVLANQSQSLILTEDKDFGEWVFSHKTESVGILFLRYDESELNEVIKSLKALLKEHGISLYNKFTVITKNKIRIREI